LSRGVTGVVFAVVVGLLWLAPSAVSGEADESGAPYRHLKPILIETDDLGASGKKPPARPDRDRTETKAEAPADRPIHVDAETRTVRVPVRPTGAKGVVEWLLTASGKHPATAVLVTAHPVRAVARALKRAGFACGRHPEPVGTDAARPPQGPALRLTLVAKGPDGKAVRVPAERLLAADADGKALGKGRWIYTGPRTVDEGRVVLAGLSGSVVTTDLRDAHAMVYWVPAEAADGPIYVRAFYGRADALPAGAGPWSLEIRPAPPAGLPDAR